VEDAEYAERRYALRTGQVPAAGRALSAPAGEGSEQGH